MAEVTGPQLGPQVLSWSQGPQLVQGLMGPQVSLGHRSSAQRRVTQPGIPLSHPLPLPQAVFLYDLWWMLLFLPQELQQTYPSLLGFFFKIVHRCSRFLTTCIS